MFENGEPVRNPYAGMHQCQISHDTQGAYRNRVPLAKKKLVEAEGLNSGGGSEARELIGDAYALFHSVDGYPFMEPFLDEDQVNAIEELRKDLAELGLPRPKSED